MKSQRLFNGKLGYYLSFKSGWQDSNLRPPHPKCGAIPGYATPRSVFAFAMNVF